MMHNVFKKIVHLILICIVSSSLGAVRLVGDVSQQLLVSGVFKIGDNTFRLICTAESVDIEVIESNSDTISYRPINANPMLRFGRVMQADNVSIAGFTNHRNLNGTILSGIHLIFYWTEFVWDQDPKGNRIGYTPRRINRQQTVTITRDNIQDYLVRRLNPEETQDDTVAAPGSNSTLDSVMSVGNQVRVFATMEAELAAMRKNPSK